MSLDVYLRVRGSQNPGGSGIFVREAGRTVEISRAEWDEKFPGREPVIALAVSADETVFSANITHNLGEMAAACIVAYDPALTLYAVVWRPDEHGITTARQLIAPLARGLTNLTVNPFAYKNFNPRNGWGTYENLVAFVQDYLAACERWPDAEVSV